MNNTNHPVVMVIEDETLLLQAICKKLEKNNLETISCVGAQQALDYLESLPELPDLIWLDYYLSKDMNGLQFMQKLKEKPEWANIPVLVVSNSASPEKVQSMLGLGAKKYFLKADKRLDEIVTELRHYIDEVNE